MGVSYGLLVMVYESWVSSLAWICFQSSFSKVVLPVKRLLIKVPDYFEKPTENSRDFLFKELEMVLLATVDKSAVFYLRKRREHYSWI